MADRCAYCRREESDKIVLNECPVCATLHCPMCGTMIEFAEPGGLNENEDELVKLYRGLICKVHLPWNIIEGIKKNAKEEDSEEKTEYEYAGFDVNVPHSFIAGGNPALEFPELSKGANALGAIVIDKIIAYNLLTQDAVRIRIAAHKA